MSSILGADGKPTTEPEPAKAPNGHDKNETRDVRTVPMGVLQYNLMLATFKLHMNQMTYEHMMAVMQQQKMVIDPPEMTQLKAAMDHQMMARDVMVGEINFRHRDSDAQRIATMDMVVIDHTSGTAALTPKEPG